MPYGKKWADLLLPPFHPGDVITSDEEWDRIFGGGSVGSAGDVVVESSECVGCQYYKRGACPFAEKYGSERCNALREASWRR
jgi:hypothetical protein